MPTLPIVPDPFYWTQESWGAALRCQALDALATNLFTTRQLRLSATGHPDPEAGWRTLAAAMGVRDSALRRVKQVHGNRVVVIRRGKQDGAAAGSREEADAMATDDPAIAVAVVAADCVPLLLADRRRGAVAAVHAGWRGTAARVAPAAVDVMQREFGSLPADLVAAVGPAIGGCCYEVGSELVDAFAAAGHERYLIDRWFLARPPERGSREPGRLRLDIPGATRDQLILAGVPEGDVHVAGLCSAMNLELMTSFRVERARAERIAGVIKARG